MSRSTAVNNTVNLDAYQEWTRTTRTGTVESMRNSERLQYAMLKLAEEWAELGIHVGQLQGHAGKAMRDDPNGRPTAERLGLMLGEVGDILWYVATIADSLGYTLSEVAEANVQKLESRKLRGALNGNGDNR